MAYSTPPTFADGNILTATQLNTLSANQEYLYGILGQPNIGTRSGEGTFYFRHKLDYFHWYAYAISTFTGTFSISIYSENGTLQFGAAIVTETGGLAADASFEDSYDVSALTVGNWYRAVVTITVTGGQLDLIACEERSVA